MFVIAEAEAMRRGLLLAAELNLKEIEVEMDSRILVHMLNSMLIQISHVRSLYVDIKNFFDEVNVCSVDFVPRSTMDLSIGLRNLDYPPMRKICGLISSSYHF